jgi:uncharacterized membrane protein YdjX (TVP38/TMEM64 family)
MMSNKQKRLMGFGIITVVIIVGYLALSRQGTVEFLGNGTALKNWIQQLGILGPLAIIGLMTLAIVMSPIPSAPIALVSGAVYGHSFGTVYVALGAELGAIIAFFTARLLGADLLKNWLGNRYDKYMLGSQTTLMGIVFVSRLLPFISFDMVSYAAGITSLSFWRFSIATLAGIIPSSYLLAHFGSELASAETSSIAITLLLLGIISLAIVLVKRIFPTTSGGGNH